MKAEIRKDGTIYIAAETLCEAYAMRYFTLEGGGLDYVLDCSILEEDPTAEPWDEDKQNWNEDPTPWNEEV
jgi:hypothetical protein